MSGQGSKLVQTWGLVQEPTGFRRLNYEFEGSVGVGGESNFKWYIGSDVSSNLVELLTEFHHVNT